MLSGPVIARSIALLSSPGDLDTMVWKNINVDDVSMPLQRQSSLASFL